MKNKAVPKDWYSIKNKADDTAEIYIYDEIGQNWWGDGIGAKKFIDDLNAVTAPNIDLRINSPGGSVVEGVAIFNALVRKKATITTNIDGLAASIASVIALAGDTIKMAGNALFMIHDPWGGCIGTAQDMLKVADTLNKVRGTILDTYMHHAKVSRREVSDLMTAETWFTAGEAQDIGFVHEITPAQRMAACHDLSRFKHVPDALMSARPQINAVQSKIAHLQTMAARVRKERS